MPYIKQERREILELDLLDLECRLPDDVCAGDMNYIFTRLAHMYISLTGGGYQSFNDIIGALEGCKLELYRKQVAPYEDEKIKQNGDI